MTEVDRIQNDPNFAVEVLIGPPAPELVPQPPGSGLHFAGLAGSAPAQFVFKKAHLSNDDFRIFDKHGQLVAVSHHEGKNPYDSLDPLGLSNAPQRAEWKSLTWVTGYRGMPSFKIRPKTLSRHGRQNVVDASGSRVYFSVGNKSRLSTLSLRHNMEVCDGEGGKEVYAIEADMVGRTLQFKNTQGQLVALAQKTTKALVMSAALGGGSEMAIDVAPGVDWTAVLACVMAVQQVGAHLVKDALSNFVAQPLANRAQDAALEATGLDGLASQAGRLTDQGIHQFSAVSNLYNQFFK